MLIYESRVSWALARRISIRVLFNDTIFLPLPKLRLQCWPLNILLSILYFSFAILHDALLCLDCHRGSDRRPLIRLPNIVCFFPKCCLDLFSHDVSVTYSPRDDPPSNVNTSP